MFWVRKPAGPSWQIGYGDTNAGWQARLYLEGARGVRLSLDGSRLNIIRLVQETRFSFRMACRILRDNQSLLRHGPAFSLSVVGAGQ